MVLSATSSVPKHKVRRIVLGDDTELNIENTHIYPEWFYVFIAIGFVFCTISCAIWFFCATCKLKREKKQCTHSTFCETRIMTETSRNRSGKDASVLQVHS